ncbi:MAG: hypothetical protein ACT4TC_14760 [Myxococcaceae bacterium]
MNPYEQVRRDLRARIAKLQTALEALDEVGDSAPASEPLEPQPRRNGVVRSPAATKAGDSMQWHEVVDAILKRATRPLKVGEIAEQLSEFREVAAGTKADNLVRNVMFRKGEAMGWIQTSDTPQRYTHGGVP